MNQNPEQSKRDYPADISASRPWVYSRFGYQRFFLVLFLILGILSLFNTLGIIAWGLIKAYVLDEASASIATQYNLKDQEPQIRQTLYEYLNPIRIKVILYSFSLTLCFFILARYCQKVLNRNRYIVKLEEEIKRTKNTQ